MIWPTSSMMNLCAEELAWTAQNRLLIPGTWVGKSGKRFKRCRHRMPAAAFINPKLLADFYRRAARRNQALSEVRENRRDDIFSALENGVYLRTLGHPLARQRNYKAMDRT